MSKLALWSRRRFLKASTLSVPVAVGLTGTPGFSAPFEGSAAADLQKRIVGTVVVKDDEHYETWRQAMIWQRAKADRRPDMIVQVERIEDVQEAVRFAAAGRMKVTTRCGGHSMAACFLRNGGMLIDVSRLDGIVVDKAAKQAVVGPGVFCRGLAERLAQDDLAFPGAHCGTVPISGFLLGGGVGLNTNAWSHGMSVFAVKALDIVTADGRLLRASESENAGLFWAARGGGPGLFGVVVRFHLQCFDAPKVIWGATYTFAFTELDEVTRVMDKVVPQLDSDVEVLISIAALPDVAEDAPVEQRQRIYLDANAFAVSEAEGRRKLALLQRDPLIPRALDRVENRAGSFDRYYSENEAAFPQGYWMGDSIWTDRPMEAIAILKRHIPDCPAPRGTPLLLYMGTNTLPDAACSRIGRFYLAYYLEWDEPNQELPSRAYCRKVFKELKVVAKGSYINEMDQEGRPEDIHDCYSPQAWARLAKLRRQWDPLGVFHGFYGQS
ncbi:FAD-binding oxidoreductase [Flavisphingomonas formosensis]|uniref:FAD-binding oxidoreductase n=1 Tax=Flavisphingomonas formosensis TaxID=861534 RepID=UPI0012F87B0D|nr:FAD-binding oxidoreductase [Sphingomonas formosensis]